MSRFVLGSVSVEKAPDFQDWRELSLALAWVRQLLKTEVSLDTVHQAGDLVRGGRLVPLLDEEVLDDLGEAGEDLGETLLRSVLLDDVEEPVVEVVFVWISEHFRNENIFSRISVEHIDRYPRVQSCHLEY